MKSRGVYETPGGTILYKAHEKLEEITLDKETQHYKQQLALKFADLVYNGQWYTPLRKAMSAFVDSTQETVTGDVKLKLYKGNIIPASVTSPSILQIWLPLTRMTAMTRPILPVSSTSSAFQSRCVR